MRKPLVFYVAAALSIIIITICVYRYSMPEKAGNVVVEKYPQRMAFTDVDKQSDYFLSSPIEINLPDLPDDFKNCKFYVRQYLPTWIDGRKFPENEKDISLQTPEDASLAYSSFISRMLKVDCFCYKDFREQYALDVIASKKANMPVYDYQQISNLKLYARYWYQLLFKYKGFDCCILFKDYIPAKATNKLRFLASTYIKTEDGWQWVPGSWLGKPMHNYIENKVFKNIYQKCPYVNGIENIDSIPFVMF
jgi:hypothetical protein